MAVPESGSDPMIDLDAYDLDGLRADVVELADLQQVVAKTLQWTILGPLIIGVAVWLYFGSRMPVWVLVPFLIVAVGLSLIGSALGAVFIVMRSKVEAATMASSRVLDTLALAHGDLDRLAAGGVTVSVSELTNQLLEVAVFPAINDGIVTTVPFPLRFLARPLVWLPSKVVEKTVMAVVGRLPIETLGTLDGNDVGAVADDVGKLRAAYRSLPEDLGQAQIGLERTVQRALATTARPLLFMVAIAFLPLLIWVLIGDALV